LGEVVARFRQKLFTHHPKHSQYNNKVAKKLQLNLKHGQIFSPFKLKEGPENSPSQ
jgi:hypothetical protein